MEAIGENENQGGATSDAAARASGRRRTPWPLVVVAVLFVVVPFLTWYWTWFGRSLGDAEIENYLRDGNARHAQHALSQIAERIENEPAGKKGDGADASRWYPQIVALSRSDVTDLRMMAAWVMGLDHRSEGLRAALVPLLEDPEPIVRRNAALALVRFGDPRCRAELHAMLRPFTVKASAGGTALTALTAGSTVKRESLLLKYRDASGAVGEARSPLPGTIERALVKDGEGFAEGAELFVLAPDSEQVSDALVGLYYFGSAEDLDDVERYARGVEGMPADVKEKAAQAAEAVKRRTDGK
jgi:HEAT repeat protein